MLFDEKLLSGIFIGLSVWIITKATMYILLRERTKAGLIADIELEIKGIKGTNEYLREWFTTLIVGEQITYSARHNAGDYSYFHAMLPELPKLFSGEVFTKILRYYKAVEEYDLLLGGFFADITVWKQRRRKLSSDDISYLSRKLERITALGAILAHQKIETLAELPSDYEGKIAAKAIIK